MDTTDFGMNTDCEAVFLKLLLPAAIENQVKAYNEAGYEVPEIVDWDLQGGATNPYLRTHLVLLFLLTGFSADMMKLFMEGENVENEFTEIEEVTKKTNTPLEVMKKALCKACYDTFKVYD
ncbi:hypothetical protein FRC10_005204 [Ceratobasidium sp. 414]|nr:hypothetical protein FRC10_005204 [Ceratobasidium sp. 414]